MSIDSLRSGAIRICFDPSLNAYKSKCRILIEGQMLDTGTADRRRADQDPVAARCRSFCSAKAASSPKASRLRSSAARTMRWSSTRCRARTPASVPIRRLSYTMTFTGTPTSDGRVDLFMVDGRWNTSTRVHEGDTADEIAANGGVVTHRRGRSSVRRATACAAAVITLTAKNAGTVGNCLNVIYNWHQRRDYAPVGVKMACSPSGGSKAPTSPSRCRTIRPFSASAATAASACCTPMTTGRMR